MVEGLATGMRVARRLVLSCGSRWKARPLGATENKGNPMREHPHKITPQMGPGPIQWCHSSQRTAEKVGFERTAEYAYYYYMIDEIDHLAELGWYHFKREEYDRTTHYYERVFALRRDNPRHYYHLAAAAWAAQGNHELAFKYLHAAVDRGWAWPERTKRVDELQSLQADPEWEVVLARMEEDAS